MGNIQFSEAPKKPRHASHRSLKDVPNAGAGPCEVQVVYFLVFPALSQGKPEVESYLPGKPGTLLLRQEFLVLGVKLPKKIGHLAFQVLLGGGFKHF